MIPGSLVTGTICTEDDTESRGTATRQNCHPSPRRQVAIQSHGTRPACQVGRLACGLWVTVTDSQAAQSRVTSHGSPDCTLDDETPPFKSKMLKRLITQPAEWEVGSGKWEMGNGSHSFVDMTMMMMMIQIYLLCEGI